MEFSNLNRRLQIMIKLFWAEKDSEIKAFAADSYGELVVSF